MAKDRSEASLQTLLTTALDARQRAAVEAVCTDMHRPYLNAVATVLPRAETVFDKFHVLQHAAAALDDVRRQEFFRAGAVMRAHGRGKRWLLLRRWATVRGSKRRELETLFAANRRLFKAYVLREQLDRLWMYKTRRGVLDFLMGWLRALRWQRLPEMERLGEFLFRHVEGIAAYCDHPVRFGVVESLNTTIKAVLRRARGMRDDQMLLLKLKWATAHPIRSARDLARFLNPQELYSNRRRAKKLQAVQEQAFTISHERQRGGTFSPRSRASLLTSPNGSKRRRLAAVAHVPSRESDPLVHRACPCQESHGR